MKGEYNYNLTITWTGNKGTGTFNYQSYERNHTIVADGKQEIYVLPIQTFVEINQI